MKLNIEQRNISENFGHVGTKYLEDKLLPPLKEKAFLPSQFNHIMRLIGRTRIGGQGTTKTKCGEIAKCHVFNSVIYFSVLYLI
jgi:hypothetical protein